jgi:hypothetical protein
MDTDPKRPGRNEDANESLGSSRTSRFILPPYEPGSWIYAGPAASAGLLIQNPQYWQKLHPGLDFDEYLRIFYRELGPVKALERMRGSRETFVKYFPDVNFDETWEHYQTYLREKASTY